jgi:selenocysteine-specific elongation factor
VVDTAQLRASGGHIHRDHPDDLGPAEAAVTALEARLSAAAFDAPEADDLTDLHLGPRELAAAERAGRLLRLGSGVVLLPTAPDEAIEILGTVPQPFTVSEARGALGTTRRVAIPLLELLDARHLTRRLPDGRRLVRT